MCGATCGWYLLLKTRLGFHEIKSIINSKQATGKTTGAGVSRAAVSMISVVTG